MEHVRLHQLARLACRRGRACILDIVDPPPRRGHVRRERTHVLERLKVGVLKSGHERLHGCRADGLARCWRCACHVLGKVGRNTGGVEARVADGLVELERDHAAVAIPLVAHVVVDSRRRYAQFGPESKGKCAEDEQSARAEHCQAHAARALLAAALRHGRRHSCSAAVEARQGHVAIEHSAKPRRATRLVDARRVVGALEHAARRHRVELLALHFVLVVEVIVGIGDARCSRGAARRLNARRARSVGGEPVQNERLGLEVVVRRVTLLTRRSRHACDPLSTVDAGSSAELGVRMKERRRAKMVGGAGALTLQGPLHFGHAAPARVRARSKPRSENWPPLLYRTVKHSAPKNATRRYSGVWPLLKLPRISAKWGPTAASKPRTDRQHSTWTHK